jgi:hypothetical protein
MLRQRAGEHAKRGGRFDLPQTPPMGMMRCPVHIEPDWLMQQLGVPVVEGIGGRIRLAAMLVSLDGCSRKSTLFERK